MTLFKPIVLENIGKGAKVAVDEHNGLIDVFLELMTAAIAADGEVTNIGDNLLE